MVLLRHYASRASGVDVRGGFGVGPRRGTEDEGLLGGPLSPGCVCVRMRLFMVGSLIRLAQALLVSSRHVTEDSVGRV